MPAKTALRLVTPRTEKRAVSPLRRPNSVLRSREHLVETEVDKLIDAAKANRHGYRDATMILVAYRHGLRASEICDLLWEQIDFASATLRWPRHAINPRLLGPQEYPAYGALHRAIADAVQGLLAGLTVPHWSEGSDCASRSPAQAQQGPR
jgi:Phage integrase family